jgi:non-ribosomal peptide synthetase component F
MFNTGDLCSWKADGTIQILGRVDDQVKVKVEPQLNPNASK